jgi:hypothetical protein
VTCSAASASALAANALRIALSRFALSSLSVGRAPPGRGDLSIPYRLQNDDAMSTSMSCILRIAPASAGSLGLAISRAVA